MRATAESFGALFFVVLLLVGRALLHPPVLVAPEAKAGCPREMARVDDFCIDKWEASMRDVKSGKTLSPYYPPDPRLLERVYSVWRVERERLGSPEARRMPLPELPDWQRGGRFTPVAVSRPSVMPQAFVSRHLAERACERAGKRLCSQAEWVRACQGETGTRFPYGNQFQRAPCNVYRLYHPAALLHGSAAVGHTDPRLNLVLEGDKPLLELTGSRKACASRWSGSAIFDMVGNLDEWVGGEPALFLGGFYARATTKGCESQVSSHAPSYYDYSTGVRCCSSADSEAHSAEAVSAARLAP